MNEYDARYKQDPRKGDTAPLVSVIIPVYNEAENIEACIASVEASLRDVPFEVLVVDAASSDDTLSIVHRTFPHAKTLCSPKAGRSAQLCYGAQHASGSVLLFVHADSRIDSAIASTLCECANQAHAWGFCPINFSALNWQFRVLRFFMNHRTRLTGISTGDQSQFVTRALYDKVGGFPDQALMEDVELSIRLRDVCPPKISHAYSQTCTRKWEQEGFWRTIWLMWRLRYRYWRGAEPSDLAKIYYRAS